MKRRESSSSNPTPIDGATAQAIIVNALSTVTNHVDAKGRFVAELFMNLVPRKDYPDYYKIITKPIAIQTMIDRLESGHYGLQPNPLQAFEADFSLLAANAMTYNQIGSDVYKDAGTLLKLFQTDVAKDSRLATIDPEAIKYKAVINKIMSDLDASGQRYTYDVFFELPDRKIYKDYYITIKNPIALDVILSRIESLSYKSLDALTSDVQLMVRNAKTYNVEGSQIYKDADKLFAYYKQLIAKYVRTGSVAPAASAAAGKMENVPRGEGEPVENVTVAGEVYNLGDFVYIVNPVDAKKPTIGQITAMYKSPTDESSLFFKANWFLRPHQTFQLASSKFMENEVLRTNRIETYPTSDIVGRCWVLFVKDYLRGKPKGADMKHVFACESRYSIEGKSTAKIKLWQSKFPEPDLVAHAVPIVPVRAPLFKDESVQQPRTPASVQQVDAAKKRKSEEFGDVKDDNDYGTPSHQDKKIKITLQQTSSNKVSTPVPHAAAPIAVTGSPAGMQSVNRESRKATGSGSGNNGPPMPSLSQQVASLPLPGTKMAAAVSGSQSVGGSGSATPAHGTSASANAAAPSSTESAGALGPIFELFDRTPMGEVKWFAGLPVHVIKRETVTHSLKYRVWKMRERMANAAHPADQKDGAPVSGTEDIRTDDNGIQDVVMTDANGAVDLKTSKVGGGDSKSISKAGLQHHSTTLDLEVHLWNPMKQAFYGNSALVKLLCQF
ncbi:hypothetical protein HDU77_002278 [Chytriomyces hyalinus]|nr:hypothetical protein HDU77_002278 [Chytriomyces hyalinus]